MQLLSNVGVIGARPSPGTISRGALYAEGLHAFRHRRRVSPPFTVVSA
ncbi:MAG: hypothetical protein ACE10K_03650 [Rhodothermales bacterium]